jgi:methyltransferase (TIGR00027 family)
MEEKKDNQIHHVSDTAYWIAAYRAEETERTDSLFNDPLAALLIGSHGTSLARRTQGSRYTAWSVVIRTFIIDKFINSILDKNIDTVINLGAGLDTRPYRLNLNSNLKWIEIDFKNVIEQKNAILKDQIAKCHLERLPLDLSNEKSRNAFFEKVANSSKNVLILSEGVIPYLSNEEAESLASSLATYPQFKFWITEYYSPEILDFLRTPKRVKQMKNAPFKFYPNNWFNFFKNLGWDNCETCYFGVESEKIGRTPPTPGWLKNADEKTKEAVKYFLGYSIYQNSKSNEKV